MRKFGIGVFAAIAAVALMGAGTGPVQAQSDLAKAGKRVFNKCRACHVVEKEQNKIGPTLHGVIGRKAGTVEGFNYSDAMRESDVTWTEETIAEYLADPKGYIPGNKMVFVGLKKAEDREAVIAYIKEAGGEAE